MVKRIFALAGVSALTGIVSAGATAGCSSNDTQPSSPDAASTAKRGTEPPPQQGTLDGGPEGEDDGVCLTKDAIDATRFPYTKALKSPGACTTKELDDLSAFFKAKAGAEDINMSDWAKEVGAKCAACVFSDGTGAEWTPILTKNDKLDDVNRGGCIEIVSGKPECGAAYQRVAACRIEACVKDCETQDEFSACLDDTQAIFTGPCDEAYKTLDKECGKDLGTYENACKGDTWTFEGPIKVQCITGGASGGGDGA